MLMFVKLSFNEHTNKTPNKIFIVSLPPRTQPHLVSFPPCYPLFFSTLTQRILLVDPWLKFLKKNLTRPLAVRYLIRRKEITKMPRSNKKMNEASMITELLSHLERLLLITTDETVCPDTTWVACLEPVVKARRILRTQGIEVPAHVQDR